MERALQIHVEPDTLVGKGRTPPNSRRIQLIYIDLIRHSFWLKVLEMKKRKLLICVRGRRDLSHWRFLCQTARSVDASL